MSIKCLSKHQISKLSTNELIEYKKKLNKRYYDLNDEITEFVELYKYTKQLLFNKLQNLQQIQNKLTKDIIVDDDDNNISSKDILH